MEAPSMASAAEMSWPNLDVSPLRGVIDCPFKKHSEIRLNTHPKYLDLFPRFVCRSVYPF